MSGEEDDYFPASDFLVSVMNEEVLFDSSDFGQSNLRLLIGMTKDSDRSNRDWATMLLGQYGPDTEKVRTALIESANDEDEFVRGEAIQALVERDRTAALPLVARELAGNSACFAIFLAAQELAELSLVALLEPYALDKSGPPHINAQIEDALSACRQG